MPSEPTESVVEIVKALKKRFPQKDVYTIWMDIIILGLENTPEEEVRRWFERPIRVVVES